MALMAVDDLGEDVLRVTQAGDENVNRRQTAGKLCRAAQTGRRAKKPCSCAAARSQDGRIVAEHPRRYGRGETIYDPWHYVPVLARKPGALRNGAPFKDWVLPTALDRVRRKLAGSDDGDRQMVKILAAVLTDGLLAVEAACLQALSEGVHSADVVINILARQRDPGPAATIMTPDALRLCHTPERWLIFRRGS